MEKRCTCDAPIAIFGGFPVSSRGVGCLRADLYFTQVGEAVPIKPIPKPPRGLRYRYSFELYTCEKGIVPNTCTVDAGTNDEDCAMVFTVAPALPCGLRLHPRDGTISGCVEYFLLDEATKRQVDKGRILGFLVTVTNIAGSDTCKLRLVVMQAPIELVYSHSDVTYQTLDPMMAFSKELIETHTWQKWRRRQDGPIDFKRTVSYNGPASGVCRMGTVVSWPTSEATPEVAGISVDWAEPLVWPKYR